MSAAEARRRLLGRLLDYDCTHTDARLACDECTVDALLAQANRADLLEAAGGVSVCINEAPWNGDTFWWFPAAQPDRPAAAAVTTDVGHVHTGHDDGIQWVCDDACPHPEHAAEPDRPAT